MRTLQEKYNAIQEGKFSKDQFLVEARMQHPNIVTRFNGYDDAVQILKNRGMISDVKIEEARLTKNSLTDYRYKPTNDMDKYPYEQILRGLRVELEGMEVYGTPTAEEYKKALTKVLKNLEKDEIFYTNQLAGNNKKVDLHDKMVDATAKNTVDTFNGMKKIKDLKEDHSKNPDDKYVVRPCKNKKEPWAVWEGEKRVKGFATKEEAKEYADSQNKKQGLTESVLKEGIKNLIKKALTENEEDVYEMQGPKEDSEYKSELADYLEDNQIYGYTDRIHNIMTGPDEADALERLEDYLKEEGIYGYTRAIESIYADYPYDQHWMNQPDEDEEEDDIPHPFGYEEASDEEDFEDLFEETDTEADKSMVRKLMAMYETEPSKFERVHKQAQVQADTTKDIKAKHLVSLFDRAKAGALQSLANQDKYQASIEGMDEVTSNTPKAFKWFWGTDAKEIAKRIQALSDKDLKTLADTDWSKSGGPQKIQKQFLDREIKKRGLEDRLDESVSLKDLL